MTIKELCDNTPRCKDCPFDMICSFSDAIYHIFSTKGENNRIITKSIIETARILQEDKKTNKDWVDLLQKRFNVSRRSAKEMLHAIMVIKRNDNFNKQFCGSRRKSEV